MGRKTREKNERRRRKEANRADVEPPEPSEYERVDVNQGGLSQTSDNDDRPKLCRYFRGAIRYLWQADFTRSEEELHGRTIFQSLADLPSLWPAALGGSRVTLLVQVCRKCEQNIRGYKSYIVRDAAGQETALQLAESITSFSLPGNDWVCQEIHTTVYGDKPISAQSQKYKVIYQPRNLLHEGDIVAIKGAQWTTFDDGKLGLRLKSRDSFVLVPKEVTDHDPMESESGQ